MKFIIITKDPYKISFSLMYITQIVTNNFHETLHV